MGALPAMNLKAGDSFDDMPASFSPSRLLSARKHGKYGYSTAPLCCCMSALLGAELVPRRGYSHQLLVTGAGIAGFR